MMFLRCSVFAFLCLLSPNLVLGDLIESWEFNEASGTQFSGLANGTGSSSWPGDDPDVVTNGAGQLVFSQGTGTQPDSMFRNSSLGSPDQSSGVFELTWEYSGADVTGGDAGGANMGFGMRDSATNSDLYLVRLHEQGSSLRLQTRIGTTNTNLVNFNSQTLGQTLSIRTVVDLDSDLLDVFYSPGGGAEIQAANDVALSATGLDFDQIRMAANTNNTDLGATDFFGVDYLRASSVAAVPEPSSLLLLGMAFPYAFWRRRKRRTKTTNDRPVD